MTTEIRMNKAAFNAKKSASMTESEFVAKYKDKVWAGKDEKYIIADLKKVYQLCCKAVGKTKPETVKSEPKKPEVPSKGG